MTESVLSVLEISSPAGTARATVDAAGAGGAGLLVLGHGAGGGIEAPDLLAAREAALELGFSVARVEQPYRALGRRSPPAAPRLDAAWEVVVASLRESSGDGALVVGGRSSGARVACRCAQAVGADGVLCLAFPLIPPSDRPSRLPELEGVPDGVPVLVVQGRNDRFGMPPAGPGRQVEALDGDHGLKKDRARLREAIGDWLAGLAS